MKGTITRIDELFNPRSVAIVGLPRGLKVGKLFLMALLDQGFNGPIYPVNPKTDDIDGLKSYPDIKSIPGPVDLAIILVPHAYTLPVIKECGEKGVKGAVLFTAGYKETGTAEGKALEDELVKTAAAFGMRLIGPNGMGLYCPKTGLSFFPRLSKKAGPVGIISHSGSLTNILGYIAPQKGIGFSKVVSLGNECDLTCADFLLYLKDDVDTKVIATYTEGIKDGGLFLAALKKTSAEKPVILWKVGLTPEGSTAAASHTGALAGSADIWKGMVRQGGGIPVAGFEEWLDSIMAFSMLPQRLGKRMAVISGPGGLAVSAAEACGSEGLQMADLSDDSASGLAQIVPETGTSLKNPIDIGLTASFDISIYIESARIASEDPGVDAVVLIGIGLDEASNTTYTDSIIGLQKASGKPFMMINIPGFDPELSKRFCEAGIPFFDSAERAMKSYSRVYQYQNRSNNHGGTNEH